MPFNEYPQPNVHTWRPDYDVFNWETDRLRIRTDWDETVILAWSTKESVGGVLTIAPEAMPVNVANHFGNTLGHEPGRTYQPMLHVIQRNDNGLTFYLTHPRFEGSFGMNGRVCHIRPVQRGGCKSSEFVSCVASSPITVRRPQVR